MKLEDYTTQKMSTGESLCPNCSRYKGDYVLHVDRYGRERAEDSEGWYCARCGYCFETE